MSALEFAEAAPVSPSQLPPGRAFALGFAFVRLSLLALLSLVQPYAQAIEFEANIIDGFLGVAADVKAGDMDGDGNIDIVGAGSNGICWWKQPALAGGTPPVRYAVFQKYGANITEIQLADVDSDGDLDVLSAGEEEIAWYANDGSGGFSEPSVISTQADGFSSVHAADLDGDGDLDVLSASLEDHKIAWYANDGSGGFSQSAAISSQADASSVYAADLDGDGDLDVLSASANEFSAVGMIEWYANDGSGGFSQPSAISTQASGAYSVYAADLDGDGDLDILSASYSDFRDGIIAWYANDGSGGFSQPSVIATQDGGTISVHAADLDGDGDLDVLAASYFYDEIWYANDGNGRFSQPSVISTQAYGGRSVHAADLDGDGDLDLLVASISKIVSYANDGRGVFSQASVISTQAFGARSVRAADLDGDGDLDVLAASYWESEIVSYANDGRGVFSPQSAISTWLDGIGSVGSVRAADLDGDDDLDLLVASNREIASYANDGSGGFSLHSVIATQGDDFTSVHAADLDADGDLDVLSAWSDDDDDSDDGKIAWYANDGSGRFSQPFVISNQARNAQSVYAADLDGDGDLDVLYSGSDAIAWSANDGSGRFSEPSVISSRARYKSVYAADLDGDGNLDVISSSSDNKIAWYANDGSGRFSRPSVITTQAHGPESVYAADLDGDGDLDVLSASSSDNKIAWYANDGSGVFSEPSLISTQADYALSVYAADLDGDGDLDVLSASSGDGKIAWYRNNLITAPGGEPWKTDPNGDINGDGISNLMAYAFPLNSPARAPYSPEATLIAANPDQPLALQVTYLRRIDAAASGLSYTAEFSSSLETGWQSAESTKVETVDATWERVTVEDAATGGEPRSRYARVIVKLN
ncbi:MAG: VCBS repeat-containing protein [Verrucomicrobiales bacterium]